MTGHRLLSEGTRGKRNRNRTYVLLVWTCWMACPVEAVVIYTPPPYTNREVAAIKAKAFSGDAESEFVVSIWMCVGDYGMLKSMSEAAAGFAKAAKEGSEDGRIALGMLNEFGKGVRQDHQRAVELVSASPHRVELSADAIATAYSLGQPVILGGYIGDGSRVQKQRCFIDVPKNIPKAVLWWRISAEAGSLEAADMLGEAYEKEAIVLNLPEAARWYQRAADEAYPPAMAALGRLYTDGKGVPKDYAAAAKWYQKAADQNDDSAQYGLGLLYEQGLGVPRDLKRSMELYHRAAHRSSIAEARLFAVYADQAGLAASENEALPTYRAAAGSGNLWALVGLGLRYEFGRGVTQNLIAACALYEVAFSAAPSASSGLPDLRRPPPNYAVSDFEALVRAMTKSSGSLLPALDQFIAHPPPEPPEDD